MKEITNVTSKGINYVDKEGNEQFIDFESCHQNFVVNTEKSKGDRYTDENKAFDQRSKNVGTRYTFSDPPTIVFYTAPPTRFEFPTRERLYEVAYRIKKAGWRTSDGE